MALSGTDTADAVRSSIVDFTSNLKPHDFRFDHAREASVLIPLIIRNGQVNILFTKRSRKLRTHAGAVSFPGGIKDLGDKDDADTALREADEEIGLRRENVEIVGILPPIYASPNTTVVPVIGLIKNEFEPVLNLDEVDFVFYSPLKFFSKENSDVRLWDFYERSLHLYYYFRDVNGKSETIFGMTAMLSLIVYRIVIKKSKLMPPLFSVGQEEVDIESELVDYYQHCGTQSRTKKLGNLNERPVTKNNSKL